MPELLLPSVWQRKEIETQSGCTTSTCLGKGTREPELDPSLSGSGHPVISCFNGLFVCLFPQQYTEHHESWPELLSVGIKCLSVYQLCTRTVLD